ncbi:MAG: hypothetical protein PHV63_02485 [Candidatus Daviesbacteria bacterium]|nr:hypothetical protein [Candidatus Daviesbacteria bacterium]
MAYSDFDKLKAFFFELKNTNFHPERMRSRFPMNGEWTTVDRTECFDLLRKKIPDLTGKDDAYLIKYLSDPRNTTNRIFAQFTAGERIELERSLAEKPVTTEVVSGQPSGQAVPLTGQGTQPAGTVMPAGLPSMSGTSIPRFSMPRRAVYTPPPSVPAQGPEPSKLVTATSSGTIKEAPEPSKLVTATRSGAVVEKPPSQIVLTDSSGNIIRKHNIPPASTTPSPASQRFNFSSFKSSMSSGFKNVQNFVARANPFLKTNLGRMFDGLKGIIGGMGRGITGQGLNGAANLGGRAGLGFINHGGDFLSNLSNTRSRFSAASKSFSPKNLGSKRALLIFGGVFFLIFFMVALGGSTENTSSLKAASLPSGGGDISSCKFTRSGVSNLIRSSTLISYITEAADKTGVPASVLASLAMHESAEFVANADDNHSAFSNNITTATGCKYFGLTAIGASSTGALGLMQVQPPKRIHDIVASSGKIPSFESVGAYSADGVERGARFIGKTADSLSLQDFCDVKTSVYLGAGVIISKNGGVPPTTGDEVNQAVCGYYGTCQYGPYNYGLEAKQDFENCQAMPGTAPLPPGSIGFSLSCPLGNNVTISCGTAASPVNNCGHGGVGYETKCNPFYYVCDGTRYSEALYHAIDVKGSSNLVTLPYINGNESVEWTRIEDAPIPIGEGSWGYRIDYQAEYKGRRLVLDLTHLNQQINSAKTLKSGEQVGTVFAGIGHLHIGLSVDGRWVEPIQETRMCVR